MESNDNSYLAPIIYIAESPEQAINYKWDSSARALDKNVLVLDESGLRELAKNKGPYFLPYDLTPGEALVRHPYNQGYLLLRDDAKEKYITETAEGMFLVARCLGATRIEYKKCDIAEYKREIDSKNGLKYKSVNVGLDVKHSLEEKYLRRIKMMREFPKQEFTQANFEMAKQIAEERGLFWSADIRSLIDARDPRLGAPMTRQTVSLEVSSSLNQALDVAFSLRAVPFFKLSSSTKIMTEQKTDMKVEWDIQF